MEIGARIKNRRLELEMSVDDLAIKIGKNRATIYRYERGDIENLPVSIIEPLANALRTTPEYLMGWTDDPLDYDNMDDLYVPSEYNMTPEEFYKFKQVEAEDAQREQALQYSHTKDKNKLAGFGPKARNLYAECEVVKIPIICDPVPREDNFYDVFDDDNIDGFMAIDSKLLWELEDLEEPCDKYYWLIADYLSSPDPLIRDIRTWILVHIQDQAEDGSLVVLAPKEGADTSRYAPRGFSINRIKRKHNHLMVYDVDSDDPELYAPEDLDCPVILGKVVKTINTI